MDEKVPLVKTLNKTLWLHIVGHDKSLAKGETQKEGPNWDKELTVASDVQSLMILVHLKSCAMGK